MRQSTLHGYSADIGLAEHSLLATPGKPIEAQRHCYSSLRSLCILYRHTLTAELAGFGASYGSFTVDPPPPPQIAHACIVGIGPSVNSVEKATESLNKASIAPKYSSCETQSWTLIVWPLSAASIQQLSVLTLRFSSEPSLSIAA